ncbi:hypothetical protein BH24ACT15_BH24ACT15_13560 [soil metagenome]
MAGVSLVSTMEMDGVDSADSMAAFTNEQAVVLAELGAVVTADPDQQQRLLAAAIQPGGPVVAAEPERVVHLMDGHAPPTAWHLVTRL